MQKIKIIEVKSEIGAGTRGSSLGIDALKIASLDAQSDFFRRYETVEVEHLNKLLFDEIQHINAKFIDGILIMEERVCRMVHHVIKDSNFPLLISGDHATAYGVIAGLKKTFPQKRLGVIWIDAHADLHSPYTTPSGNMHGMSVAMACGIDNIECKINDPKKETLALWDQIKNIGSPGPKMHLENLVYIATRDLEKSERYLFDKHKIKYLTTKAVRAKGAKETARETLDTLQHCDLIYISFDVDSIDSAITSGTGTPVPNGLTFEEAKTLNIELAKTDKLCAWEMTEINPTFDTNNLMAEGAFEILETTGEIIAQRLKKQKLSV